MAGKPMVKFRDIFEAIRDSNGILSVIAERSQCSVATIRNAAKKWPAIDAAITQEREATKDHVENKFLELIDCPDAKIALDAMKFFLDRKCKDRGYGNKTEISADINGIGTVSIFLPHNGRDDASDSEQTKLEN
jgi:hypothetical protein